MESLALFLILFTISVLIGMKLMYKIIKKFVQIFVPFSNSNRTSKPKPSVFDFRVVILLTLGILLLIVQERKNHPIDRSVPTSYSSAKIKNSSNDLHRASPGKYTIVLFNSDRLYTAKKLANVYAIHKPEIESDQGIFYIYLSGFSTWKEAYHYRERNNLIGTIKPINNEY